MTSKISHFRKRIAFGVLPAMATPLAAGGRRVNTDEIAPLVEFLIDRGIKGLFVGGTTGEGILLEASQRRILHEQTVAAVGGRVPLILHIGANSTRESLGLLEHAVDLGADAVAAVTPYYYPVHDEALLGYYSELANAAPDMLLFGYDIPQFAVNAIGPNLLARLVAEIPTFAGIKTSRPDVQAVRQLLDEAHGEVLVLVGNERAALGLFALGASGLISGLSTAIPEPFVALASAVASGDMSEARQRQRLVNSLLDLMPEGARIGALKSILAQRGIMAGPAVPPRPMPSTEWVGWSGMKDLIHPQQF